MGKRGPYKFTEFNDYREWLTTAGYSPRTVQKYVRGTYRFYEAGYELSDENIQKFKEQLIQDGQIPKIAGELAQGVKRYKAFKNGAVFVNRYNKFHCNDDCFNCPYEDCMKPDYMCHSTEVNDGNCN